VFLQQSKSELIGEGIVKERYYHVTGTNLQRGDQFSPDAADGAV
jgi:hypothetical protein